MPLQAAWLLSLAGADVGAPKEFDDPNATCTNILNGCKKLGFAPPSYHQSKLSVRAAGVQQQAAAAETG
jgi:intraflagellar transport protein 57